MKSTHKTTATICSDDAGLGVECDRKEIDQVTNSTFCTKYPGGCPAQRNVKISTTITEIPGELDQGIPSDGVKVEVDILGLTVCFDFIESAFVHQVNPNCYTTREIAEKTARKIAKKSTFKVYLVEGPGRVGVKA